MREPGAGSGRSRAPATTGWSPSRRREQWPGRNGPSGTCPGRLAARRSTQMGVGTGCPAPIRSPGTPRIGSHAPRPSRPGPRAQPGAPWLLRVGTTGIELVADQPELLGAGRRGLGDVRGHLDGPADRRPDLVEGRPGVERVEPHLARLVEVVDPEIRDDDARAAAQPALLAPDPLALLRPTEIAGTRPEVDRLDEAPRALAHDHEHLAGVDRDLARAARTGQARG